MCLNSDIRRLDVAAEIEKAVNDQKKAAFLAAGGAPADAGDGVWVLHEVLSGGAASWGVGWSGDFHFETGPGSNAIRDPHRLPHSKCRFSAHLGYVPKIGGAPTANPRKNANSPR